MGNRGGVSVPNHGGPILCEIEGDKGGKCRKNPQWRRLQAKFAPLDSEKPESKISLR
jgi:hypothetical protein